MSYYVCKINVGTPHCYTTEHGLTRALKRFGAAAVEVKPQAIDVRWDNGQTVTYAVDENGNVDPQLAWDMEP